MKPAPLSGMLPLPAEGFVYSAPSPASRSMTGRRFFRVLSVEGHGEDRSASAVEISDRGRPLPVDPENPHRSLPFNVKLSAEGRMPSCYRLEEGNPMSSNPTTAADVAATPKKSTISKRLATMKENPTPENITNVMLGGPVTPKPKKVSAPKKPKPEPTSEKAAKPSARATQRDPRIPKSGTKITGKYKGKSYEATVLDEGFDFKGQRFSSLSAIGMKIRSGKATNGYAFFGLGPVAGGAARKAPAKPTSPRTAPKLKAEAPKAAKKAAKKTS